MGFITTTNNCQEKLSARMAKTSQYQSQLTMKNRTIKKVPRNQMFKKQRPKDDWKQAANGKHMSFLKILRNASDEERSGILETELAR